MRQRTLGRTGLQVSELALGGLFTSSLAGGVEESRRMLKRAFDLGINLVDTAPAYADSEKTLGQALDGIDHPFILSTKLGGRPQPFDPQNAPALKQSVEESLKLLGREVIDVLMIHEPDRPQQYLWWTDVDRCQGPVLDVMRDLKKEGKIRFTGLGGTTMSEMASLIRAGGFDVVLTAFNYNLLFREAESTVMTAAKEKGMGIVIGSVLGQGALARRFDDVMRNPPNWLSPIRAQQFLALYEFVDDIGLSLVELGLRFVLGNENVSTVLIGPKTAEQVEESVAVVEKGPLSEDIIKRLDEIAAMVPYRPFEEPMILPFGKAYYGPGMANLGAAVPVGKLESE